MIAQNEMNVHGELENKIDYRTVSYKHSTGKFHYKLKNDTSTIIPYPTVEVKHL